MNITIPKITSFEDVAKALQILLDALNSVERRLPTQQSPGVRETNTQTGSTRIVKDDNNAYNVLVMSKEGWLQYNGSTWELKKEG